MTERHENPRYLPGYELHPDLVGSDDFAVAVNSADRLFEEPPVMPQNVAMFRAIAETLGGAE